MGGVWTAPVDDDLNWLSSCTLSLDGVCWRLDGGFGRVVCGRIEAPETLAVEKLAGGRGQSCGELAHESLGETGDWRLECRCRLIKCWEVGPVP